MYKIKNLFFFFLLLSSSTSFLYCMLDRDFELSISDYKINLFKAIKQNDENAILILLDLGLDLNLFKNKKGETAMQYATRKKEVKLNTIRFLIKNGAKYDFKNDDDQKLALIHIIDTNPQGFN